MIKLTRILPEGKRVSCYVNANQFIWMQSHVMEGADCTLIFMASGPELYVEDAVDAIAYHLSKLGMTRESRSG
jgi:hypothetical protein